MGNTEPSKPVYGLILGSNNVNLDQFDTFHGQELSTEHGQAFFWVGNNKDLIVLPRHGRDNNIPPHMINHRANILGFHKLGVDRIISFTSVGSLKLDLKPGHMIMPDDYINFYQVLSYYNDKIRHIVPGLDSVLRDLVKKQIEGLQINMRFNGIYIQTQGPRLETKAEIQMLKNFGDVVGMTMASEATLAKELDLSYANVSVIDNFCNGLTSEPLSIQALKANQEKNCENITKIIHELIKW
ncbi:MTAP family purine nucleoside phosphorylase [[Eubacterium] cellulosolvens]